MTVRQVKWWFTSVVVDDVATAPVFFVAGGERSNLNFQINGAKKSLEMFKNRSIF